MYILTFWNRYYSAFLFTNVWMYLGLYFMFCHSYWYEHLTWFEDGFAERLCIAFTGTVLRDRFRKCWRKLTDLGLNQGRGWFLNFSIFQFFNTFKSLTKELNGAYNITSSLTKKSENQQIFQWSVTIVSITFYVLSRVFQTSKIKPSPSTPRSKEYQVRLSHHLSHIHAHQVFLMWDTFLYFRAIGPYSHPSVLDTPFHTHLSLIFQHHAMYNHVCILYEYM